MKNILAARAGLVSTGTLLALFFVASIGAQLAHAAISTQMDIGSRGDGVTQVQTYLAKDPSIYPSGLITGYFGPLTQAAIKIFQTQQGIVSGGTPTTTGYGRVGPMTMARLNALMDSGQAVSLDMAPVLSVPVVRSGSTSATFSFSTNESTTGQVYYDTSPIIAAEATGPHQTPYVSGLLGLDPTGMQMSHSVSVSSLQRNTTYYFLVRVIDNAGNSTLTWPPVAFTTTP